MRSSPLPEHFVQQSAGAAIAVGDEDRFIAAHAPRGSPREPRPGIFSGRLCSSGGQALHVEVAPVVGTAQFGESRARAHRRR